MNGIIIAAAIVAGLGLVIGVLLGIVGKVFDVQVDEKEAAIREVLPGNNCGGCGFAGCDALAAAIAKGEANANACPVGGVPVAEKIAKITGGEVDETRLVAFVHCAGTPDVAEQRYTYTGNLTCREAATMSAGGPKACQFGCLGYGSCVDACEFDAVHIVNGVAVVDKQACKACGKCVKACPKHLIDLIDFEKTVKVRCASHEKGKAVMMVCKAGCIACGMCERNCPADAIHVENNIAVIDYSKCINCGTCAEKCPKKCIIMENC